MRQASAHDSRSFPAATPISSSCGATPLPFRSSHDRRAVHAPLFLDRRAQPLAAGGSDGLRSQSRAKECWARANAAAGGLLVEGSA